MEKFLFLKAFLKPGKGNLSTVRIRSNSFIYNRDGDDNDYVISAFGGSIIYRSGYLNGFGFTTALYTSNNLLNIGDIPFDKIKSAKDTFSR